MRFISTNDNTAYLQPHAARSFINALNFHREIFEWKSDQQTTIVFRDSSDVGNASAGVSPRNTLFSEVSPMANTFETFPPLNSIYTLMNHEVMHLATQDAFNAKDQRYRRFFGGKPKVVDNHPETILYAYLTTPRYTSPRWYSEGSAVFMETWMSGGIGRAQAGYDEMVFRAMVRDNAHFYSNLGLVSEGSSVDFNTGTNAYLYGGRFMSYLAYTYSPQQFVEWIKRGDDSQRYYADQFEKVFGSSLEEEWQRWIAFEHEFQSANLESVNAFPLTRGVRLANEGLGSVSRSFVDTKSNSLIGGFYYPGVVPHIGSLSLDDGGKEALADIKGPLKYSVASTAYDPQSRTLFYTEDNARHRDLLALDLETHAARVVAKNTRIGDLALRNWDQSLWGIEHRAGLVTLVAIPAPYERLQTLYSFPYGTVMSNIDISPNGKYLSATMGDIQGRQSLQVFLTTDLVDGKAEPVRTFDFGRAIPEGFVFSPDGRYLYGSSYFTGVSNIFRYELETGEMEAVSNAETGFFRPIPQEDGSLIVFEYTGQGFVPTRIDPVPLEDLSAVTFLGNEIAKKHPVVGEWGAGSPADIDLESMIISRDDYVPRKELTYESGYPIIEGYKTAGALGYSFNWSDALILNSVTLDLSYTLDDSVAGNEKLHVDLEYKHLDWRLRYWHNDANFYDLFGPTERSRKGDAFIVSYDKALTYDPPRRLDLSADLAYYTGLDTLPINQNIETTIDKLASGNLGLTYTNTRRSQGAVDHEKGYRWDAETYLDYADSTLYPKLHAGFDFGFSLPFKHSSLWFYNSVGAADGDRADVFTNYYFGGFGNNYVDDGDVSRYRDYDSMPGFEIGEISARHFVKSIVELNFPPIRFREVGTPAFYLSWIKPAVFAGSLLTDPGTALDRTYSTVGTQFDLHFTLAHRRPMTLSVGYAQGFASGGKSEDEWMISLKVL
jgi:hypothetical protein